MRTLSASALAACAVLLILQPVTNPMIQARAAGAPASPEAIVYKRSIPAGGRTVLTVETRGTVEVVIFEDSGDAALLREFHTGRIPRTAKTFTNIRTMRYPLASEGGGAFFVRVRRLTAGSVIVHFQPGTITQAMAQLRNGRNLVRNQGTVLVRGGLHHMPVYQLVPGTIIRLTHLGGSGSAALLTTREYVAVRNGTGRRAGQCLSRLCLRPASGSKVLELKIDDYDDRYLAASSVGEPFIFSYQIIATPETLNYITTCT